MVTLYNLRVVKSVTCTVYKKWKFPIGTILGKKVTIV